MATSAGTEASSGTASRAALVRERAASELSGVAGVSAAGELHGAAAAAALDAADELKAFRAEFNLPRAGCATVKGAAAAAAAAAAGASGEKGADEGDVQLYLCGNSLGLQPRAVAERVKEELDVWALRGVEGHFEHEEGRAWVTTDEAVQASLGRIVGASADEAEARLEVAAMNSLTANLHFLMAGFYRPTAERFRIVIDGGAFPSDLYAVQSQVARAGFDPEDAVVQLLPREGEDALRQEDIEAAIRRHGDSIALVLMAGVQYYTGQFFDIETITRIGHEVGARVGWDLAHAVGNVELKLHDWDVDFACWCSYKYLNSGPGNIGGAFLHSKHARASPEELPRLAGWWGHKLDTRFSMRDPAFDPEPGIHSFRVSNPPVLCVAALLASVEIFDRATMARITAKSRKLTLYLEYLLTNDPRLTSHQAYNVMRILTPADSARRGAQLSLDFGSDISSVADYLAAHNVTADVRKPSVLRVAPAPLYNTFSDVHTFVQRLADAFDAVDAAKQKADDK